MVDEAGRNMKKLFDVTNTLLGRTTPTQFPCSTDGVPLPECFNTFFVDKISRIICRIDARAEPTVTEYQAPRLHGEDTLYQFTESTVADIKHIIVHSTSKTCALDPVPTSILKDNAEIFAPMIMQIVNASLQSGTVPADMKHALVTPLHKRHGLDSNNFANYRPVSNIGFVSKVLERYVANAVREHVDNNGYNDAFQSAYRPRHSTETALVRIHNDMMQSMDCRRGVLLVLLDLSAAFDTLDHGILLKRLHDIGVRHTALEWFKSYLDDRTFTVKIGQTMSARSEVRCGVLQGSVLGPMLFNVYCLPIGDIFAKHNVRYHIYADDTQLYVECPPNDHTDASRQITECVEDLRRWLTDNRLLLNEDKTEAILFRSSCPVTSTINIGGSVAQLKPTVRDIGVVLDTRLDMASQVSNVCRSAYYHLFRIAKIRASLTIVACKTLVHALVISRLDYGNALLYGITDRLLHRLEMIQHSAARIIMCIKRHDRQSITAVLRRLHWLPVKWRINYKIVVLVFRALHGLAPAYLSTLITPYEPRRALRSTDSALLCVPRHKLERYGRRSFSCAGPVLWNSLPEDMRLADSLNSFKSHLKTHYFKLAYNL